MKRPPLKAIVLTLGAVMALARTGLPEEDPDCGYAQTQVITPAEGCGAILGFCVPSGGGLVAVTGASQKYGAGPGRPGAAKGPRPRLVWFAADGTEDRVVNLDFAATVVGAAPDGGVYVAGDGVMTHYSAEGQETVRAETPQPVKSPEERAALEKALVQRHEAHLAALEKHIARMRETVAELEQKVEEPDESADEPPEAEESEEEARHRRLLERTRARQQARRMAAQLRQQEAQLEQVRRQDPKELVDQGLRRPRQVRSISASRDAVFVVLPEASGQGSAVWRLDLRLENPEKIVSGLTGCCGQMDVQVCGERLAIAANRKHCVDFVSFTGQAEGKVGQRGGDAAGFGGCCNPMNTCPAPAGGVLTSESNGLVKRFDADGGFVEIVGKAKVRGGCKNSAIAIEPDGSRLYYMDVEKGSVIVLTRVEAEEQTEADAAEAEPGATADVER